MSRALLEEAQDLIMRQAYDEAREILVTLQDRSSTARRWLANLNELEAEQAAAEAQDVEEDAVEAPMASDEEAAARPKVSADQPSAASGEYHAFSETYQHDARQQWEYREIVLANWNQNMDNIEYALEQGGDRITVEDAYVRLLNENGAQGWEVIAEEILPQQHIRLLMKRPVM